MTLRSTQTGTGRHALEVLRSGGVPRWIQTGAAVGWRLLVIAAVLWVGTIAISRFQVIVVPVVVAVLVAAVLAPPVRWLERHGVHSLAATWLILVASASMIFGLGWFIVPRLAGGFADFGTAVGTAYTDIRQWLIDGPFALDPGTVAGAEERLSDRFRSFAETGLTSHATMLAEIITAFFLTLVTAFFFVKDGPDFCDRIVALFPDKDRPRARRALERGWWVTQRYLLGVVVVGAVDAVVIGAGLALIGVPHVIPLMAVTFFAAFFPLVGAIFAGGMAAMLALSSGGVTDALLVVGLTIVVQQLDGDIVAPLVFSRAVDLHPLSILLALTAGGIIAGIVGAFLAVPLLAASLAIFKVWRSEAPSAVPESG